MSLIGHKIKANLLDEYGDVQSQVSGTILEKIVGIKKVRNQLPTGKNENTSSYFHHVAVDFYLIQTEDGLKKVECLEVLEVDGFSSKSPSEIFPYVGHE